MAGDVFGFNRADSAALLGLIGKGAGESFDHSPILESRHFFTGKLTGDVAPGSDGEFTVWNAITETATSIVIPDAYLPSAASASAPAGTLLGVVRDDLTGRWLIQTQWC